MLPGAPSTTGYNVPEKDGELLIVLLDAKNLAVANRNGSSDPYVKVVVKPPVGPEQEKRTKEIRETLTPVWNTPLSFDAITHQATDVNMYVKDWNRIGGSKAMGEVHFQLRELGIPTDGTLVEKELDLMDENAMQRDLESLSGQFTQLTSALQLSNKAQGTVRFLIGWKAPAAASQPAQASQSAAASLPEKDGDSRASSPGLAGGAPSGRPAGGGPRRGSMQVDGFEKPREPGELCVVVLGARGLAAADSNGKSDPYAKLKINTGVGKIHEKQTKVVKKSLDPRWKESFMLSGVTSEATEITLIVKDYDLGFLANEPLGQVDFRLADRVDMPRDGTLHRLPPLALHAVSSTASQAKSKRQAQGFIDLMIGWIQPSAAEEAAIALKSGGSSTSDSKEIAGLAINEDEEEYLDSEEEGGGDEAVAAPTDDPDARIGAPLLGGDYQLQATIIEARDLAGRDASGLSDPCVFIECFGQTRHTTTVPRCQSAVWYEQLFVEGKDLKAEDLQTTTIRVSVYDMDTLPGNKDDLIGEYTIDFCSVFYEPHHEIWQRWVALSAPHTARTFHDGNLFGPADEGGVQGYVKLSLALLGPPPADKPFVHGPEEDEDASAPVLLPPSLKLEVVFLVVGFHRAESLPAMDDIFGQKTKGAAVDPYLKLEFAGYKAKTPVVYNNRDPAWLQEFWVPVLLPTVGKFITITVRDYDTLDFDDDIDVLKIPFDSVRKGLLTKHRWWNLYGLGARAEAAAKASLVQSGVTGTYKKRRELQKNRAFFTSEWRGKLLMTLSVHKPEENKPLPEKLMKRMIPVPRPQDPKRIKYELRAMVLLGANLDHAPGFTDPITDVLVEFCVEEFVFRTKTVPLRNGTANWMPEKLSDMGKVASNDGPPGVLRKTTDEDARPFMLTEDVTQLGDVGIYVCVPKGKGGEVERVAWQRLSAKEAMAHGYGVTRRWQILKPSVFATAEPGVPLPALLLQVLLCPAADIGRPAAISLPASRAREVSPSIVESPWPPLIGLSDKIPDGVPPRGMLTAYELRLHVFQARDLPATDDNGVTDAYVVAKMGGSSATSSVQKETTFPQWYETLVVREWLPDLQLCPPLTIDIWDKDELPTDPDDFIGTCHMKLSVTPALADGAMPDPTWLALERRGIEGGQSGEVLALLQVLPLPKESVADDARVTETADKAAQVQDSLNVAVLPALSAHPAPMPVLEPEKRRLAMKVCVLGLRGLRPAALLDSNVAVMGIRRPFVQLDFGKRKGNGPNGAHVVRTAASSEPSSSNPSYMAMLDLTPLVPTNELLLSPLNVCVYDTLFGGLRKPLIGSTTIDLASRIAEKSPNFFTKTKLGQAPGVVEVEAWENQRWSRKEGWLTVFSQSDPPEFSSKRPPFQKLPLEAFELPNTEWQWTTEWMVDKSLNRADDGWLYALDFTIAGVLYDFDPDTSYFDFARRRRWIRTRELLPAEERAISKVLKEQATLMDKKKRKSIDQAELRGGRSRRSTGMAGVASMAVAAEAARGSLNAMISDKGDFGAQTTKTTKSVKFARARVADGTDAIAPVAADAGYAASDASAAPLADYAAGVAPSPDYASETVAGGSSSEAGVVAAEGPKTALLSVSEGASDVCQLSVASEPTASMMTMVEPIASSSQEPMASSLDADIEMGVLPVVETRDRSYTEKLAESLRISMTEGEFSAGYLPSVASGTMAGEMTDEGKNIAVIEMLEGQLAYKRGRKMRFESDMTFYGTSQEDKKKIKVELELIVEQIHQLEDELEDLTHELDGVAGADDDPTPSYMRFRSTLNGTLEETLERIPFDRFEVWSGQGRKRFKVGTLKALVRVAELGAPWHDAEQKLLARLKSKQEFFIRVYILKGENLMSQDNTGASDPYIKVKLGKQEFDNREQYETDKTEAHFLTRFDLHTNLPGISVLNIECWDYDGFGRASDDLIGVTEVDLEDRVFSDEWPSLSEGWRVPVERRNLYSPKSQNPQGQLDMWIDIMTPQEAEKNPPLDISPPPKQEYELRVICWSAKDVPEDMCDGSGLADFYASIRFGKERPVSTDTHFRAEGGKASWNWRFKIPVTLDSFMKDEMLRLTVQLWDKDLVSANDCIGEELVSLGKWMRKLYKRRTLSQSSRAKGAIYWDPKQNWDLVMPPKRPLTDLEEKAKSSFIPGVHVLKGVVENVLDGQKQPLLGTAEEDPELEAGKFWLPIYGRRTDPSTDPPKRGKVLLSVQLVPIADVEKLAAGYGRKEPNANPVLPRPVGRLHFSLNPCVMIRRLIGPKYCAYILKTLCCVVCILILVLLIYYMFPVVLGNLITGNVG